MATTTFGQGFKTPDWRAFNPTANPGTEDIFARAGGGKQTLADIGETDLYKTAAATAKQQLQGDVPGFEAKANEAREALIAQQRNRTQNLREGLLGQGLGQTGTYLEQGWLQPEAENARERTAFERGLAADKATLAMQQQQAGQNATNQLLGAWNANQQGLGDLAIRERQLVDQAKMYTNKTEWETWAKLVGLDNETINRTWQTAENDKKLAQTEKLFYADLTLKEKTLFEQARQFDNRVDFDKWALQQNLTENERQRLWQALENEKNRASTEKMFFADLTLKEKTLAEQARQFDSKQAYDRWALQMGLDENEKQRIWQACENEKNRALQWDLAEMSTDLEKWKQGRAEEMQKLGFTHDEAMQQARLEAEALQKNLDRQLQAEVEAGRLTLEEKKLAENARQFNDKAAFDRWALQQGWKQDEIARAWQANENAAQRAFTAEQATYDRQLQKEIEAGRLTLENARLAENARQFNDRQAFETWALQQGWEQDAIARAWQANENVLNRTFEAQENALDRALQQVGMSLTMLEPYLKTLPPDQAAAVYNTLAGALGFNYVPDPNDIDPATGKPRTRPGFAPPTQQQRQDQAAGEITKIYTQITQTNRCTPEEAQRLMTAANNNQAPAGFTMIASATLPYPDPVTGVLLLPGQQAGHNPDEAARQWNGVADWATANTGKFVVIDGKLYRCAGAYNQGTLANRYIAYYDPVVGDYLIYYQSGRQARMNAR